MNPTLDTPIGVGGQINTNTGQITSGALAGQKAPDATTLANFQAANPGLTPDAQDLAMMTGSAPISSSALSATKSATVPPSTPSTAVPGALGYIGSINDTFTQNLQAQAAQTQAGANSSLADLIKGLSSSSTEGGLTDQAYSSTVDPLSKEVAGLSSQITAEQVAARHAIEQLQANPGGLSTGALASKVNDIQRDSLSKQADLAVILSAKNGQLDVAKSIADRAVTAKLEQQKQKNDMLQYVYEQNKSLFDKADQRAFESAQADRNRALDEAQYKERARFDQLIKQSDPLYQAQLSKARSDAKAAQMSADQNTPQALGQQLATGLIAPAELSKRATGVSSYNAVLKAADDYSMATTGKHFDIAKADRDYKFATNVQTQNTLNYLGSLIGTDGQTGNLDELLNSSNAITRSRLPALNNVEAWGRLQTGDPQIAAYYATVTEVSDQIAKILQGGGTGSGTSDAKLAQAQALFQKSFSKEQVAATVNAIKPLLANRARNIVGDNPYLSDYASSLNIQKDQTNSAPATSGTLSSGLTWHVE